MLRLEFRMPLAGHFAAVVDVGDVDTVEVDNVVPMRGGRAMAFVTITGAGAVEVPASLADDPTLSVEYCGSIPGTTGRSHLLVVVDFDSSVLSTVVAEGVVPHRFLAGDGGIDAVVTVDDWSHLRDLASAIEAEYGTFDLRGTTELDRPGYPLGRDRFEYALRGYLTPDQVEVLQVAYEMGHFAVPQQATSGEVAEALDIGRSTLSERLRRAENDLLRALFSGPDRASGHR